ncbi:MAG: ABC transporter ATP-binding protein, partial [Dehalococcoidia bacterium]|nr:ABC transporter ATP-binding protein [Dehalococcoidia bacterium]
MRAGTIQFEGRDLTSIGDRERRAMRGQVISMVFQDPIAGLNPTLPVGQQIEEVLRAHTGIGRKEAKQRA